MFEDSDVTQTSFPRAGAFDEELKAFGRRMFQLSNRRLLNESNLYLHVGTQSCVLMLVACRIAIIDQTVCRI